MTGVYLFAAAAGVPLLAWFLFGGGDGEGSDAGGGDDSVGGLMLRWLPLSTLAMAFATFGVSGLLLGVAGISDAATLIGAGCAAALAGALNSTVFAYLRRSDSTATVEDRQLAGATGRVVLPIGDDRRGRVAVSVGGQLVYLTAQAGPGVTSELEVGAPVLVVEVSKGVATVDRLDPELI